MIYIGILGVLMGVTNISFAVQRNKKVEVIVMLLLTYCLAILTYWYYK